MNNKSTLYVITESNGALSQYEINSNNFTDFPSLFPKSVRKQIRIKDLIQSLNNNEPYHIQDTPHPLTKQPRNYWITRTPHFPNEYDEIIT